MKTNKEPDNEIFRKKPPPHPSPPPPKNEAISLPPFPYTLHTTLMHPP